VKTALLQILLHIFRKDIPFIFVLYQIGIGIFLSAINLDKAFSENQFYRDMELYQASSHQVFND